MVLEYCLQASRRHRLVTQSHRHCSDGVPSINSSGSISKKPNLILLQPLLPEGCSSILLLWLQRWAYTHLFSCWHWPLVLTKLSWLPLFPSPTFFVLPNWIHQEFLSPSEMGCPVPDHHSGFCPYLFHFDLLLTGWQNHTSYCRSFLKLLIWHNWVYVSLFT